MLEGSGKWCRHIGNVLQVKNSLNIILPYDSAVVLPSISPTDVRFYVYTETYKQITTSSALFIISPKWKQPRYLSVGEWIRKLQYISIREYSSVMKRKEPSGREKTWMNVNVTAVLFIAVLNWKQPGSPTAGECTNRGYSHAMEYYHIRLF